MSFSCEKKKIAPFHRQTLMQFGLLVSNALVDNVLSDHLWEKFVLLPTFIATTTGQTSSFDIT